MIARSPAQDRTARSLFHDKNTITADPHDSQLVYATWTLFRTGITSLVVSRSTDAGSTWSPAIPVATMGTTAPAEQAVFRQGAQIVVLPDRTLVNAYFRILFDEARRVVTFEQAVLRSVDQGATGHASTRGSPRSVANNLGLPVVFPQDNSGVFVDSHDRQSILFVR